MQTSKVPTRLFDRTGWRGYTRSSVKACHCEECSLKKESKMRLIVHYAVNLRSHNRDTRDHHMLSFVDVISEITRTWDQIVALSR